MSGTFTYVIRLALAWGGYPRAHVDRIIILAPAIVGGCHLHRAVRVYWPSSRSVGAPDRAGSSRTRSSVPSGPDTSCGCCDRSSACSSRTGVSPTLVTWSRCSRAWAPASRSRSATSRPARGCIIIGGIFDMLDGRLARAQNRQSAAGALFDSVADRWAELALFTDVRGSCATTAWLFAVMAAIAGSVMVSYTRARGEGLGLELRGGAMQRAERIVLVRSALLVAAWFDASRTTAAYVTPTLGAPGHLRRLSRCGPRSGAASRPIACSSRGTHRRRPSHDVERRVQRHRSPRSTSARLTDPRAARREIR